MSEQCLTNSKHPLDGGRPIFMSLQSPQRPCGGAPVRISKPSSSRAAEQDLSLVDSPFQALGVQKGGRPRPSPPQEGMDPETPRVEAGLHPKSHRFPCLPAGSFCPCAHWHTPGTPREQGLTQTWVGGAQKGLQAERVSLPCRRKGKQGKRKPAAISQECA